MEILDNPSQEEFFDLWCEELIKEGYIKKVLKQEEIPFSIVLFDGLKQTARIRMTNRTQTLLEPVTYKPDRVILWEDKSRGIFFTPLEEYRECYFVGQYIPMYDGCWMSPAEVKAPPGYGGGNSSDVSFAVKQKWVYAKAKIFVNKVFNYPNALVKMTKKGKLTGKRKYKRPDPYLWMMTFTPTRYFYTDRKFDTRIISKWPARTLQEFLKTKNPTTK